jgi:predicted metal-dependent hydrolase
LAAFFTLVPLEIRNDEILYIVADPALYESAASRVVEKHAGWIETTLNDAEYRAARDLEGWALHCIQDRPRNKRYMVQSQACARISPKFVNI